MQKEYSNKAMKSESAKTKVIGGEDYHFSGQGKYKPVVIKAETLEEATEKYEKEKELINK